MIIPQETDIHFSVPKNYIGKKIEILAYAVDELTIEAPKKNPLAKYKGAMTKQSLTEINKQLSDLRNEWE